jgi:4'-phosphopantetheinyl transferase
MESKITFSNVPSSRLPPGSIRNDEVHLWATRLDTFDNVNSANVLSPDDLFRANRFVFARHRLNFIRSRAFLRCVLGRYTGLVPSGIEFRFGPYGKPFLAEKDFATAVQFNLSHCDDLALIAITKRGNIGVDIESVRELETMEGLARRFLAPNEFEALAAIPKTLRSRAFFQYWTRKEAVVKTLGTGLLTPLNSFEVSLAPGHAQVIRFESGEDAGRWSLLHLEPMSDVVGAVATSFEIVGVEAFYLDICTEQREVVR